MKPRPLATENHAYQCPACHGQGEALRQVIESIARALATSAVRVTDQYWEQCKECKGTGQIDAVAGIQRGLDSANRGEGERAEEVFARIKAKRTVKPDKPK